MGPVSHSVLERAAQLVLEHVERVYPHKPGLVWSGPGDVVAPDVAHPIFHGCFDWHSAVHSHWTLARLARHGSAASWAKAAGETLEKRITAVAAAGELRTLDEQSGFEVPYGLAWLLTLTAEGMLGHPAASWPRHLVHLEERACDRLVGWARRLVVPERSGQHGQTAFALTLGLRWARRRGNAAVEAILTAEARRLFEGASGHGLEPSAYDFLSPRLAAAELMAELSSPTELSAWLDRNDPDLGRQAHAWAPVVPADRSDGKLAHFDGLNLSRAWMLRRIAAALPEDDLRRAVLAALAERHGEAGLKGLGCDEYAVTHWLPTFAVYWLLGD